MKKQVLLLLLFLVFVYSCSNSLTGNVVKNPVVVKSQGVCTDDDNGLDFNKRAVVKSELEMKMDSCVENVLQEYYCDSGQIKFKNYVCVNGCYAGRCN